jgi:hypothetical protein
MFALHRNICKLCVSLTKHKPNNRYYECKRKAKDRWIAFSLTPTLHAQITSFPCVYCGEYQGTDSNGQHYVGVDRLDSSRGYTQNNSLPACSDCNFGKNDRTIEEFARKNIVRDAHLSGATLTQEEITERVRIRIDRVRAWKLNDAMKGQQHEEAK